MPDSFLDSNIILYQFSADPEKSRRAEGLIATGGTISVQVLNEVANVARRKIGLDWTEIRSISETLQALLTVVPMDAQTHAFGLRMSQRFDFSLYGGMIVAAALRAGCDCLWSEDMQDGLRIEGRLVIRNPFSEEDGGRTRARI